MSSTTKRVPAGLRLGAAVASSAIALTSAVALAPQADAATLAAHGAAATSYTFTTLDNQADPTFNQLLGINSHNEIAGYFGSGAAGHPNKGYTIVSPYGQGNYTTENFPGSAQTQVTGLNNKGDTVGFWVTAKGTNRGFVEWNGVFASYTDPDTPRDGRRQPAAGHQQRRHRRRVLQRCHGHSHAYQLNQATGSFKAIKIPGAVSATATGINNNGDVVGFFTDASGTTSSFLVTPSHHLTAYQFPGGSDTQAFGINGKDQIVGSYLDGAGVIHGFVLSRPLGPGLALAEHRRPERRRARPWSTASTTPATWSASTPTPPATPTACWPRRSSSACQRRPAAPRRGRRPAGIIREEAIVPTATGCSEGCRS